MKKLILLLLLVLLLTGCSIKTSGSGDHPQFSEPEIAAEAVLYQQFDEQISRELNRFRSLWSDPYVGYSSPSIVKESVSLDDMSSQGALLTRYYEADGEVIRYLLEIYGETGRVTFNYYFPDDIVYVQRLATAYSSIVLDSEGSEMMRYDLQDIVLQDEDVWLMDHMSGIVVPNREHALYAPKHLEDLYQKALQ